MGPETAGFIFLSIIGGTVSFIAWLNSESCKIGRHQWGRWERPSSDSQFQERTCTKCGKLDQASCGCSLDVHQWSNWGDVNNNTRRRSCEICHKVQDEPCGCSVGHHQWSAWSGDTPQERSCVACKKTEVISNNTSEKFKELDSTFANIQDKISQQIENHERVRPSEFSAASQRQAWTNRHSSLTKSYEDIVNKRSDFASRFFTNKSENQ